jgi:NAD(P)-dependent dehydrogenase (short-subunit alcohol dehydrogenase family)
VLAVNVGGVLSSCQAFVPTMIERRQGSIVLIGSVDGLFGQPGRTNYTASKHPVGGLVKNLAIEWGHFACASKAGCAAHHRHPVRVRQHRTDPCRAGGAGAGPGRGGPQSDVGLRGLRAQR